LDDLTLEKSDGTLIEITGALSEWDATNGWFIQTVMPSDISEGLAWEVLDLKWVWTLEGVTKAQYEKVEVTLLDEDYYGVVSQVVLLAGLKYRDFGMASEEDLGQVVSNWLYQATDFIDTFLGHSYDPALVPAGIESIANRIAANTGALALQRRTSPIVKVGDFSVGMLEDKVISGSIRADLEAYKNDDSRAEESRPKFAIGASNRLTRLEDLPLDQIDPDSVDLNTYWS
jgi:hypothetical protein